jgi:hypothetical protein
MAWSWFICETISGRKLAQVEASGSSPATRKLNGVGTGTHEFVTSTLGVGSTAAARRSSRLDLTRTWSRTVVQCWNGKPMYAGVIVGKAPGRGGTVSLRTVDVREVLKYRTTFGISGYNGAADEQLKLEKQSLASIAGYLIWDVMQGPTGNWQLPLILPPRDIAGPHDRTYHEFNLPVIERELAAIQNTDGGPDVDFDPKWSSSDTLQWEARVGALTGSPLQFNQSVPQPPLTDFGFVEDGNAQGNVFYAIGNGSDRDLKVARSATILAADEPALERIVRYTQERDQTVLQARADEDLRVYKNPTRQYSFSMQADGTPSAGNLRLGQRISVYTQNDDWLPDGWLDTRLVGFTIGTGNTVQLQLQEQ